MQRARLQEMIDMAPSMENSAIDVTEDLAALTKLLGEICGKGS